MINAIGLVVIIVFLIIILGVLKDIRNQLDELLTPAYDKKETVVAVDYATQKPTIIKKRTLDDVIDDVIEK